MQIRHVSQLLTSGKLNMSCYYYNMITILGIQFNTGKTILTAPDSECVRKYLAAAKKGKGLAKKHLKSRHTSKKV